jgi:hypothetical protein
LFSFVVYSIKHFSSIVKPWTHKHF